MGECLRWTCIFERRVWRYQRGNQNLYIEEEQTTQWPIKKNKRTNNDLQNMHIKQDRVTRTPLKTEGELRCSRRVSSSCSTSGTRRVNLVTNPMINHEWGKDQEVFTTSGTYPWSFVTLIFHNGQPSHGDDRKTFEVNLLAAYIQYRTWSCLIDFYPNFLMDSTLRLPGVKFECIWSTDKKVKLCYHNWTCVFFLLLCILVRRKCGKYLKLMFDFNM